MRIFVINPGSTSTKFALYEDENIKWKSVVHHSVDELARFSCVMDQLDYRLEAMRRVIAENDIDMRFDAVIGRGGLLKPTPGGVYAVDEAVAHDLIHAEHQHACNLGGLMAADLAAKVGCPAYIADPEVVDEFIPEARLSGLPELPRISIFHALNSKAVARRYARLNGLKYEDLNLIVIHLGGGISVSAHRHGRVIDSNNALNGDGPFSPERAGTLPADALAQLCFSGRYSLDQIRKMINGYGGLTAHLGSNDVADIARRAAEGEEPYRSVLDSMLYGVSRETGARAVALKGDIDAIIITGGIAHSDYCIDRLKQWISWIAPISIRAGEDELGALAMNALAVLTGEMPLSRYAPA